jgi:hypothetical protein
VAARSNLSIADFGKNTFDQPGTPGRGGNATVNGSPATGLTATDGETIYVATTGPAYPVRIQDKGGAHTLDLGEYNAPLHVKAPRHALDISHLPPR